MPVIIQVPAPAPAISAPAAVSAEIGAVSAATLVITFGGAVPDGVYTDDVAILVNGEAASVASATRQADPAVIHYVLSTAVWGGDEVRWAVSGAAWSQDGDLLATNTAAAWTPAELSPTMWLDVSRIVGLANNDPITTLTDYSGSGNDATGSGSTRPTYAAAAQNGLAVARFSDVATQHMVINADLARNTGAISIAIVCNPVANGVLRRVFWLSNSLSSGSARIGIQMTTTNQIQVAGRRLDADTAESILSPVLPSDWLPLIVVADWQATTLDLYRDDGAAIASDPGWLTAGLTSNTASLTARIGGSTSNYWNTSIGEVVVARGDAWTAAERARLYRYLASRWGLYRTHPATLSVGSGTWNYTAARVPHQRSCFFAAGRYWAFYGVYSGTTGPYPLRYVTSTDGITWTAATEIGTFPFADAQWSLTLDAATGHLHVATNITTNSDYVHDGLQYRRGTPQADGTIAWDAAWQTVIAAGAQVGDFSLAVDTLGRAWVGYNSRVAGNNNSVGDAYATRQDAAGGTWATASGFPAQITSSNDARFALLSPLADGGMHAAVYRWDVSTEETQGYVSDGGAFVAEGAITEENQAADNGTRAKVGLVETASHGGETHLIYQTEAGAIRYGRRSAAGVWAAEVELATSGETDPGSSPRLSFGPYGQIVVMWTDIGAGRAYLRRYDGAAWRPLRSMPLSVETGYEHLMPAEAWDERLLPVQHLTSAFAHEHWLLDTSLL